MAWTCYLSNETDDPLVLVASVLRWGHWRDGTPPPLSIDPKQSATFECDSFLDKYAGSVTYTGPRGNVTVSWDVPLIGDPTYSATPSGALGTRAMGSGGTESGGVMYAVTAPAPAPRPVPTVPKPATPAPATTVTPAPGPGRKYTTNPNEVTTVRTTPSLETVVAWINSSWPEIGEVGARTLASQWAQETGAGRNMYNNNLGNIKGKADEPHMYLHNNTECWRKSYAESQIAASPGLVYYPDDAYIRAHGVSCKAPLVAVVTQPPHPASRFRAYPTLAEGSVLYIAHHKRIAARIPEYLPALLAGDTDAVAHILSQQNYYNGSEDVYKRNMKSFKKKIDQKLGPVSAADGPTSAPPSSAP
jgi:hypothetical protein